MDLDQLSLPFPQSQDMMYRGDIEDQALGAEMLNNIGKKLDEKEAKRRKRLLKKRKRDPKLGLDAVIELSDEDIRSGLKDASDILTDRPHCPNQKDKISVSEEFHRPCSIVLGERSSLFPQHLDFYRKCVGLMLGEGAEAKRRKLSEDPLPIPDADVPAMDGYGPLFDQQPADV